MFRECESELFVTISYYTGQPTVASWSKEMNGGRKMAVGLYDHDIILKPNRLLLNLELMKVANYYHRQNKSVVLMKDLSETDNFEKVFIFRNLPEKNVPANIKRKVATDIIFLPQKNIEYFGLVYSGRNMFQ